eukprot:1705431-Prymnesium_polylepis.1
MHIDTLRSPPLYRNPYHNQICVAMRLYPYLRHSRRVRTSSHGFAADTTQFRDANDVRRHPHVTAVWSP